MNKKIFSFKKKKIIVVVGKGLELSEIEKKFTGHEELTLFYGADEIFILRSSIYGVEIIYPNSENLVYLVDTMSEEIVLPTEYPNGIEIQHSSVININLTNYGEVYNLHVSY